MSSIVEPRVLWTPVDHQTKVTLISKICWVSSRPLEITVIFGEEGYCADCRENGGVAWTFARDLIVQAAKEGSAGLGDVRVWVSDRLLTLRLTSPFGDIKLRTEAPVILNFITRTFTEVGREDESDQLHLGDDELREEMLDWGIM